MEFPILILSLVLSLLKLPLNIEAVNNIYSNVEGGDYFDAGAGYKYDSAIKRQDGPDPAAVRNSY